MATDGRGSKRKKQSRMPETIDYKDKYEGLRREFGSEKEEQLAKKYIDKYFELQSIPDPQQRLRSWNRFSETVDNTVFESEDSKYRDPDEDKDSSYDYRDELSEEESEESKEYRLRTAEVNQTYYINRGSTVAYVPSTGRFEPAPAHTQLNNTGFFIPRANDEAFDEWLMSATWEEITAFRDDEREAAEFTTLATTLLRLRMREKSLVLKHLKNSLAKVDIQQMFGESKLAGFEALVYVNNAYRLVLIFKSNKLVNYCLKKPKFT